jgi:hypothetical protein
MADAAGLREKGWVRLSAESRYARLEMKIGHESPTGFGNLADENPRLKPGAMHAFRIRGLTFYGNVPFFRRHSYEFSILHLLMMVVSLIGAPIVQ